MILSSPVLLNDEKYVQYFQVFHQLQNTKDKKQPGFVAFEYCYDIFGDANIRLIGGKVILMEDKLVE